MTLHHPIALALSSLLLAACSLAHGGSLAYEVVERKPLSRDYFTQGLEFVDGDLLLSSGLYGKSLLVRLDADDLSVKDQHKLDRRIFAEGLTVLGDEVFQLTWRNRAMLVYQLDDFQPRRIMKISGEGWGLTNDGESLIYSDGSHNLFFISPASGEVTQTLPVTDNGAPVARLNELEWIAGEVWANVWGTDRIVIINPDTGKVRASLDLDGLLPVSERRMGTDVLNGIAHDKRDGAIWITGKRWPWLYRIEVTALPEESR
ncbi:MAG: glutaminyl-peptide cyclotransferase [Halioglobus sp.]